MEIPGDAGWVRWVFVTLVVTSAVPSVVAGGVTAGSTGASGETGAETRGESVRNPVVAFEYALGDGTDELVVSAELRHVEGVSGYRFRLPDGATVVGADGFTVRDGTLEWDGTTAPARFRYRVSVEDAAGVRAASDEWVYLESTAPDGSEWDADGTRPRTRLDTAGVYATPQFVALGNVTVDRFDLVDGRRAVVVAPGGDAVAVNASRIEVLTRDLDRWFPLARTDPVTEVLVVPYYVRPHGARAIGSNTILMGTSRAVWRTPEPEVPVPVFTTAHEFAHLRTVVRTGDEMAWYVEGVATYYEHRYPMERREGFFRFYERINTTGTTNAAVALSEAAPRSGVSYQKGAHVLTALDVLVRSRTDGEARLDDVLDRVNAHQGPVSYDDFRAMVHAEAGSGLDGWLDRYVRHGVAPPFPDNASLLPPPGWNSTRAPSNLYFCLDGEWVTEPESLPAGEPVPVFDTSFAVTRFSNATQVGTTVGECGGTPAPVESTKYGESSTRTYRFEGDATLTFRSAYDPDDVTRHRVDVVSADTPTPTPSSTLTPTLSPTLTPTSSPTPTPTTVPAHTPTATPEPATVSAGPVSLEFAADGVLTVAVGNANIALGPLGVAGVSMLLSVGLLLGVVRLVAGR